ncbi:hypothetical protein C8R44DRAFT_91115 [Mycena epipterygia]|nr:hypothetical protein C8R44DRAFT_91115 [Mycena epipterygia]
MTLNPSVRWVSSIMPTPNASALERFPQSGDCGIPGAFAPSADRRVLHERESYFSICVYDSLPHPPHLACSSSRPLPLDSSSHFPRLRARARTLFPSFAASPYIPHCKLSCFGTPSLPRAGTAMDHVADRGHTSASRPPHPTASDPAHLRCAAAADTALPPAVAAVTLGAHTPPPSSPVSLALCASALSRGAPLIEYGSRNPGVLVVRAHACLHHRGAVPASAHRPAAIPSRRSCASSAQDVSPR